jgi:hypothetical protein
VSGANVPMITRSEGHVRHDRGDGPGMDAISNDHGAAAVPVPARRPAPEDRTDPVAADDRLIEEIRTDRRGLDDTDPLVRALVLWRQVMRLPRTGRSGRRRRCPRR